MAWALLTPHCFATVVAPLHDIQSIRPLPLTLPRATGQVPIYHSHAVRATDTLSPLTVEVTLTNSGPRAGEEVVQLYGSDLVASVTRPEISLLGFVRVALAPGSGVA